MKKISAIALASAVAGALALAGAATAQTKGASGFKCWGVAKAGLNDCAGQSKADYDLGEWKAVKDAAACTTMGGADKPGKGKNTNVKM